MRQKKTYPCSLNAAFLSCCPNLLRSYEAQRCVIQAIAFCCFSGSELSLAYTRTLVSTKTLALMKFISIRVPGSRILKQMRGLGKIALHQYLVALFLEHCFLEHFAYKARNADLPLCSTNASP